MNQQELIERLEAQDAKIVAQTQTLAKIQDEVQKLKDLAENGELSDDVEEIVTAIEGHLQAQIEAIEGIDAINPDEPPPPPPAEEEPPAVEPAA